MTKPNVTISRPETTAERFAAQKSGIGHFIPTIGYVGICVEDHETPRFILPFIALYNYQDRNAEGISRDILSFFIPTNEGEYLKELERIQELFDMKVPLRARIEFAEGIEGCLPPSNKQVNLVDYEHRVTGNARVLTVGL